MSRRIDVHVERGLEGAGRRFIEAWRRAERGGTGAERHVSFESWDLLASTLSGKRLALLRHLRRQPAASIAELARSLHRDYKRVHEDVEALSAAGLIERNKRGLRADYDQIRTSVAI